ncbi:hypothetical protein SKAU_G00096170 [Synaphobranchus kaupii]|uniref:Myb/SANT-like DNA-binding domain-containing protein n=1 Tax=Synaphobranchus kaupii TaxID=118154 RepID=A0A9Q1J6P0_SYNKA|nr:hypothetical protein SKAU_G00096170 [Synaphobranchus kaupii]
MKKFYVLIADKLTAQGIPRTSRQCREKVKKLKHTYKTQKDNNSRSGAARKTDRYYNLLDSILGCRPSMRNDSVLDSFSSSFSAPSMATTSMTATQLLEAMVNPYDDNYKTTPEAAVLDKGGASRVSKTNSWLNRRSRTLHTWLSRRPSTSSCWRVDKPTEKLRQLKPQKGYGFKKRSTTNS